MVGLLMRRVGMFAVVGCLAIQLSGCVAPAALESQSKQRDIRLARIYFLREGNLVALYGSAAGAEIQVDGKPVGAVIGGTYFFVDRPPGTYKLSAGTALSMAYETQARVEAGQTYYFGIGTPQVSPIGQNLVNQAVGGSGGATDDGEIAVDGWLFGGRSLSTQCNGRCGAGRSIEAAVAGLNSSSFQQNVAIMRSELLLEA